MAEAREAAGRKGDVRERVAISCPRCDRSVVFVLEKGEGKKFVLHVDRDEDGVPANPATRTQDDDKYLCEKCFTDSRCAGSR